MEIVTLTRPRNLKTAQRALTEGVSYIGGDPNLTNTSFAPQSSGRRGVGKWTSGANRRHPADAAADSGLRFASSFNQQP
jgi:hypothetical protein